MANQHEYETFYTPNDVAALLRMTPHALANWRWRKKGPPYYRLEGLIRYPVEQFWGWVRAQAGDTDAL